MATRIFFLDNEILIDTIPTPFVSGSLVASMNGDTVEISRVESDFIFTAIPWGEVATRDGSTFSSPDAAMAYVTGQLALRRPFGGVASYTAGADLGGHRALMFDASGSGEVLYADPTSDDYVFAGVSLGAAAQGASLDCCISGLVTELSWSWAPLQPVYVAPDGVLTQSAPVTGFFHILGFAVGATSVLISAAPLVLLNRA